MTKWFWLLRFYWDAGFVVSAIGKYVMFEQWCDQLTEMKTGKRSSAMAPKGGA